MTETRRTDGAVDRMWRGFNGWGYIFGAPAQGAVALDIVDEGETVVVKASLPGISPEDIQVTIEDDVLTLKGEASEEREDEGEHYLLRERRYGGFHRAIRLPDTVDTENAETALRERRPDSQVLQAGSQEGPPARGKGQLSKAG